MAFSGFTQEDFDTFHIEGLEGRMEAIRQRIQPKFKELGGELLQELSVQTGEELFLHIAQHARRTINAPVDTWMAFAGNKRGYKQHPHFQIGLFDDHVFIWLALIYELPSKQTIAKAYIRELDKITALSADMKLSFDHMKKEHVSLGELSETDLIRALERFRDVKKVEFLIGRTVAASEAGQLESQAFLELVKRTFTELLPLYQLAKL
ncbi:Uncharacterized protein YktB, UPF0637 family [Paenibacillus sp. UNCCL117]|uniref:YktB family protein n=1 Tax=unclassified Paenibacillus TaxID=185978 RepID=UPI000882CFA9|nr:MULTISPECIES: DUF1054 domain-containing protein [unclassified Paenibacillus]SDC78294.1 Uncharacterized protein YktB, UPF0637 family [Paenibacillus sp. cl123]SFW26034.1 Uncharacterized protein YktB, UPF0637 family [Paenibacillus sp. UNCCL117]